MATENDDDNECYKMDHKYRGRAIIINNVNFQHLERRDGGHLDRIALKPVLEKMQFNVDVSTDLTADEMKAKLKHAAEDEEYNRESDCFVCVISSHGGEGEVMGTDEPIELRTLFHPFKNTAKNGLSGKPKIFLIQACRGRVLDHGGISKPTEHEPDHASKNPSLAYDSANGNSIDLRKKCTWVCSRNMCQPVMPTDSDFLIGYSVPPGYESVRDPKNGTWFLQEVSKALKNHWRDLDLLSIMTKVNRNVAKKCVVDGRDDEVKEIPCITSMLTKNVQFQENTKM